jgi:hypothetical protein
VLPADFAACVALLWIQQGRASAPINRVSALVHHLHTGVREPTFACSRYGSRAYTCDWV